MIASGAALPQANSSRQWLGSGRPLLSFKEKWALFFLMPFAAMFVAFVSYPILYALFLATDRSAYARVFADPIYARTLWNTFLFIAIGVMLKMLLALGLSSFFVLPGRAIRVIAALFILPWAVPHIPSILSIRWMLNSEWGMINNILFQVFGVDGPAWLTNPSYGMASIIAVHIWKYLPFWTMILVAARLGIPKDLYESARIDGAGSVQQFRYVTFPAIANVFLTSTMLTTIWSLGDFNSIYLLTGGGPMERTNTLATMGIRYAFRHADFQAGIVTLMSALPILVPLVIVLTRRLRRNADA
ncbi:carbohydrate ABC transporter permease [Chelatococcus asaccharovorans]|uniref:Carbohydrate ABC transporter membrane protein 1 (CUT1 family) n=1 Tax=Chelatococcus asaccharovorans TaxID=28210 RepID=A0A2V3TX78_9HYPH|nr:sugar ABC transporter permease [Chelatococcus asaccharovorans]PXW53585.1 carbohydrate ABC transporter membrane protein 1 (CUT1 family) [Chelatococcus asaccharovorans]CAH1652438.1 Carbohydrate ABC transporter membrane protein 1 (CUT1 family) [Chelatococcus asaccharovorans]CAH1686337.1 Carbohydrate ABC transporter membrane protein 1 (CUT1 family) [Chelatococcus asaccharovorans]